MKNFSSLKVFVITVFLTPNRGPFLLLASRLLCLQLPFLSLQVHQRRWKTRYLLPQLVAPVSLSIHQTTLSQETILFGALRPPEKGCLEPTREKSVHCQVPPHMLTFRELVCLILNPRFVLPSYHNCHSLLVKHRLL
jgi:hypothetical protein